jgi:hypothetical protein
MVFLDQAGTDTVSFRCEAEDLEPTEFNNYSSNIDDAPYRISDSPDWQSESPTTDLVSSFSGTSLSRVLRSPADSSSGLYSGDDRWVGQYELASRASPAHGRRHEGLWSQSSTGYNRDGTLSVNSLTQADSWTSASSAWNPERSLGGSYSRSHHHHQQYNLYDTMSTGAGTTNAETSSGLDRSRPNRRNADHHLSEVNINSRGGESGTYSSYGQYLGNNADGGNSQNIAWSFQTEAGDKMGFNSSSRPFTPAPSTSLTLLNPNHHQGWPGGNDSGSNSPQAQVQASLFPSLGELPYFTPGGDRFIHATGDYRDG